VPIIPVAPDEIPSAHDLEHAAAAERPRGATGARIGDAVGRILGAVVRKWAGDLDHAAPDVLRTVLRRGAPRDRIATARLLGRDPSALRAWLADPVPGVRREAARGVGLGADSADVPRLEERLAIEPTDSVRFEVGVALVRCGTPANDVRTALAARGNETFLTVDGPRSSLGAVGPEATTIEWRFDRALAGPTDDLVSKALRRETTVSDLGATVDGYARRMRHVAVEALGELGDPDAISTLERVLEDMEADPGFGFRSRRTAAFAIARIGDPTTLGILARALEREALDHEGRPGSGLGIQAPVRAAILYAIGEVGNRSACRLLAGYLAHTHGSALGGLHLPAMGALVKLGGAEEAAALLDGPEAAAVHALPVLAALGRHDAVRARLRDRRSAVARLASALVDQVKE
jgi:HEAT repeat protein